ncbi:paeninodin family lasso peptide [Sporosarcina sp. E16_3]|nr:paeninodin family lasso peptide [Sporosarcina sp. E16_3]MBO0602527.1 paeninodin family lasso peptide [Sporosarcina sp. E16_3]
MKKEWKTPELEVLDVHETMAGFTGNTWDTDIKAGEQVRGDVFS